MHGGILLLAAMAAHGADEAALRRLFRTVAGQVSLPAGVFEIKAPLEISPSAGGLEIRGSSAGTTIRASSTFRGAGLVRVPPGARGVRLRGFTLDGSRGSLERRSSLPPDDVPFIRFTELNGIAAEGAEDLEISQVRFAGIAGFAVLSAACRGVRVRGVSVEDSGSRNAAGRNNATGGILFEEGTADFEVTDSVFRRVRGNGVWTHSRYRSPRNGPGRIASNRFEQIGRDAIQAGHATRIAVQGNTGLRIGYPPDIVDVEGGATPVAIDTAGNVDASSYSGNSFREVNGKCIDLDGFHDGLVRRNSCVNTGKAEDYPHGHFGIVVNNWNPDMRSENIVIEENVIDGSKFGGIFLIGNRHRVTGNRLLNLNLAGCNESAARYGCVAIQGEPDVLQAGIYLGRLAAEWAGKRADPSRGHLIRDNVITGHKMKSRCILAAPGVAAAASDIGGNRCEDR